MRVEVVRRRRTSRPQIIGGDLKTLLYMTQLAAISQDPWFSRVAHRRVRRLRRARSRSAAGRAVRARARRRALDPRRARRARRRSASRRRPGADGLHIYIPLPPGTPYEAGLLFCQIVATVVAQKHPKLATVERIVKRAASASTSTTCRTFSARRSRPPTARAPATTPAFDAADVAGNRRRVRPRRVHDRIDARTARDGRRSLGGASIVERRRSRTGDALRKEAAMIAIRPAVDNDLADILRIYNQAIEKTTAVFEYQRPHARHAARLVPSETGGVPACAGGRGIRRRRGLRQLRSVSRRGRRTSTRSSSRSTWTNRSGDMASAPRSCEPSSRRRVREPARRDGWNHRGQFVASGSMRS